MWLAPRDAAQLDALATAVSDPSSAQYGQFLSADQVRAQFAPTADQVTQVSTWLSGAGLTVGAVGADNRFVAVSGTAAAINAAFGTQLTSYVVGGHAERAPATDLSVPVGLAGTVQAVTGITTFGHMVKQADFGPPDAFVPGTPCSAYYGQKIADRPAEVPRQEAAVQRLRLHGRHAARRLRRGPRRHRRRRRDRRDHGRL